jgi:hypothetical protein
MQINGIVIICILIFISFHTSVLIQPECEYGGPNRVSGDLLVFETWDLLSPWPYAELHWNFTSPEHENLPWML